MDAIRFFIIFSAVAGIYLITAARRQQLVAKPVNKWVNDLALRAKPEIVKYVQTRDYLMRIYTPVSYIMRQVNGSSEVVIKIYGREDLVTGYVHPILLVKGKVVQLVTVSLGRVETDPLTWP